MTPLRDVLDDAALAELRARRDAGEFDGLTLQHMLEFLLSDGIMPESGLPVASFLALEEWAQRRVTASSGAQANDHGVTVVLDSPRCERVR